MKHIKLITAFAITTVLAGCGSTYVSKTDNTITATKETLTSCELIALQQVPPNVQVQNNAASVAAWELLNSNRNTVSCYSSLGNIQCGSPAPTFPRPPETITVDANIELRESVYEICMDKAGYVLVDNDKLKTKN